MGSFSYISIADDEKYNIKYKFMNILTKNIKEFLMPHMPSFVSCSIQDMGVDEKILSGYEICIPFSKDNTAPFQKKLSAVLKNSPKLGINTVAFDPLVLNIIDKDILQKKTYKFKISRGLLYTPFSLIEAAKMVSGLIGIDFRRSNICIADAASEMGIIAAELLLNHAAYLTLCTENKEKVYKNIERYMKISGLSAAVVSNYKKAMMSCDILIYTGNIDINMLISFTSKKMLIINLTGEKIKLNKHYLIFDEVIMQGPRLPIIKSDIYKNAESYLTSRMWEGALFTLVDIDNYTFQIDKVNQLKDMAKRLDIKMKAIVKCGQIIDRESIYAYR